MFRNILVSVDGSSHAGRALTEAIDLAASSRARLTILTAIPSPPAWSYAPSSAAAIQTLCHDLQREYAQILQDAVDRVPDTIPVTKILATKPIRKALMHELSSDRYDLLVMGSRGRGALSAQLLGSVSHFALDRSPIPVLIVHAETADQPADRSTAYDATVWPTPPSPQANSIRPSSSTAPS